MLPADFRRPPLLSESGSPDLVGLNISDAVKYGGIFLSIRISFDEKLNTI